MIAADQVQGILNEGVVLDETGAKVGKVGQVFVDDASGEPEWVTASTGLFGTTETFIPLREASVSGSQVRVPYTKDFIKDAPRMDVDEHLSEQQESELYRYYSIDDGGGYGMAATDRTGDSADDGYRDDQAGYDVDRSVGQDTSGPNTDDAMTRSEERLDVHTDKVATGRARLRKYIVTDNVTTTVPVEREEVRIEREPITEANRDQAVSGGDLTEEEHEVTLSEERVVVNKETVPVERVRLDKETVTEQTQVTEEVRKEQIEADLPDGVTDGDRDRDLDRGRTDGI